MISQRTLALVPWLLAFVFLLGGAARAQVGTVTVPDYYTVRVTSQMAGGWGSLLDAGLPNHVLCSRRSL